MLLRYLREHFPGLTGTQDVACLEFLLEEAKYATAEARQAADRLANHLEDPARVGG